MIDLVLAGLLAWIARRLWRTEPRRLRIGVLLLFAAWFALQAAVEFVTYAFPPYAIVFGIVAALLPLLVLLLAGYLIANGVIVLRRERRSLSHALSLILGVALIAVPVGVAWLGLRAALSDPGWVRGIAVGLAVLGMLLAAYLGVFFVAFLGYGWLYRRSTRTATGSAVIVLGCGLIGDRVSPLLAGRLDRGAEAFRAAEAAALEPILVPSGGKGDDELRAEGDAMRDYLVETSRVPASRIFAETASTNTEENLRFSAGLVAEHAEPGATVIATSDYHALRAALLARRLGLAGRATGASTAHYFVPSATLREFAAVALMHVRLQIGALAVAVVLSAVAGVVVGVG